MFIEVSLLLFWQGGEGEKGGIVREVLLTEKNIACLACTGLKSRTGNGTNTQRIVQHTYISGVKTNHSEGQGRK